MQVGKAINEADNGMGYDHNYVLRASTGDDGLRPVARVWDPSRRRAPNIAARPPPLSLTRPRCAPQWPLDVGAH